MAVVIKANAKEASAAAQPTDVTVKNPGDGKHPTVMHVRKDTNLYYMRVCQNPLFNKITPATDTCDRGDFSVLGVLTHPLLLVIKNRLVHILIDPSSEIFQNLLYQLLSDREYPD